MRGILLFRGRVIRSPNSHGKNTTKPTKNATQTATTKHYDWALLNNRDIRDKYVFKLRNRFETLQEKEEKIPQTTNMRTSLTHTSRQHRSVFQQNLERNIEPHGKRKRLEKNVRQ